MKKQSINLWLLAALLCGLSLTVTSCKDDDDDNGSNGDESEIVVAPTETEEAKAALNWLANMTNVEEFTDDWASKTYEPTIGVESKNEANTRVVVVADIDYARMNFSSISGIDPDKLSSVQSQTIDGVGTVTWTPSAADANNLATVDVNTKLIPHLSKIVYCTMEQAGDNGSTFDGTAYFRFGDVLEDQEGYYWVCVKPAFGTGKAAQQQGYWINVFNRDEKNGQGSDGIVPPIPKANICSDYDEKYNGNTILLPTKLKSTKEMTHNLANLVWALLNPEAYETAVDDDGIGLGGYDYKYNGQKFCERVAEQWKEKGIWQKLFNRTYEEMKQFKKLNFYYEGYHFTPKIHLGSSNLGCATVMGTKRYEPKYVTTYNQDSEKNLEMKEEGAGFDMRRYCSDDAQNENCASSGKAGYAPAQQFSDTEGYWIVRQKTSSEIDGTVFHPSVYDNLKNMREIYRYNAAYQKSTGNKIPVEVEDDLDSSTSYKKRGFYDVGDVVKDENSMRWLCVQPSSFGSGESTPESNYAYFISFTSGTVGKNLENVPLTKELAAQILFNLAVWYQNWARNVNTPNSPNLKRIQSAMDNCQIDFNDFFARRDTLHDFGNNNKQLVQCAFGSTVYRSQKGLCVLRLILDVTKQKSGTEFAFSDTYSCAPGETMLVAHLCDADMIAEYADDKWIYQPWRNPVTNERSTEDTGKRTNVGLYLNNLASLFYDQGNNAYNDYSFTGANNMYREPLIPFAVKRVKDTGSAAYKFDDKNGTKYQHVKLVSEVVPDFANDSPNTVAIDSSYGLYKASSTNGQITLNGKPFDFKMTNKP